VSSHPSPLSSLVIATLQGDVSSHGKLHTRRLYKNKYHSGSKPLSYGAFTHVIRAKKSGKMRENSKERKEKKESENEKERINAKEKNKMNQERKKERCKNKK
jgi:hypothetical protein